ncbi:MBOAT family O-acyltransferase [Aquabacterium sp. J223]|uniref:MBOAT family O-acyltransferase n=1 Tax=Aquabacterium sp. J223 TaxID=2898431 RepID=UPI0021AE19F1|nr:MBOAT family O-acyltransferase [Aquabacterium sp. J223]UUX96832.1 MBOAT family protein [Aquabacterium sp. J223]
MLFNSLEFLAFFGIVYGLYLVLPFRGQNTLLLLAGYVFYGWWDVNFLFLIAFSTTVDFWIGLMLAEGRVPTRQRWAASVFIVAAAVVFLCVDWAALVSWFTPGAQPLAWTASAVGGWTVVGSLAFVLVANATHDRIAAMAPDRRRRLMLFMTVFVNLAFLGCFKYFNFFIDSAESALAGLGLNPELFHLHIVLPVGISFYTFQSLSYTIDVSRGLVKPTRRLQDFALFVAYFPPMVAGPIERARHLLPQLLQPRRVRWRQVGQGLLLILFGLFKKVAIADGVAPAVNAVFNSSGAVSAGDIAMATVLFAVQIFCDFSGYSDIARGVSKMMGIELMLNFRLPYFSKNPSEFWRRWHISLSSWLRDYLYISLGGNRRGEGRTYFNLMATMTLGGLWHGAAWNFVLWGVYQGALLCVHRFFTGDRRPAAPRPGLTGAAVGALQIAFFFVFVCYGWLLFRANSFDQIVLFTQTLLGFGPSGVPSVIPKPPLSALAGMALLFALQLAEHLQGRLDAVRFWPRPVQGALCAVALVILVMGTSNAPVQFIYFQF